MSIPANNEELLKKWHKRLREIQFSNYEAAKSLGSNNNLIGIPLIILTTITGTTIYKALEKETSAEFKWIIVAVTFISAILAALQTFFKYSEKAERHRAVGAKAGSIRREVEQILAAGNLLSIDEERIKVLREGIDKLSEGAPSIPDYIWEKAKKVMDREESR